MERFIKIVIESAARKHGATVKVSVVKEGEENETISTPTGRTDSDSEQKPGCILSRHGARENVHRSGKDETTRRACQFGYMPEIKN